MPILIDASGYDVPEKEKKGSIKMKKILSLLLCCVMLCAGFCLPDASAASDLIGQDSFRDGEYTFTKCDFTMGYIGTNGVAVDNNYWYPQTTSWGRKTYKLEELTSFSDGLLLVFNTKTQKECYLDEQGEILDLNRGRFQYMFPFTDGRAAVVDENNKVGYIDTEGNLIIPCQYDVLMGQPMTPYVSIYEDGYAWVLEYDEGLNVRDNIFNGVDLTGTYRKIDKDGNVVPGSDTPLVSSWQDPSDEIVEQFHLSMVIAHNDPLYDALIDTSEDHFQTYNSPKLGSFRARFGTSDTGIAILWTGEKDSAGNPINSYAYVVKRTGVEAEEFTYGQSTYQIKGYTVVNRKGYLLVDVTNDTNKADEGDLFYVMYVKYKEGENTADYLPAHWIIKAHYELEPHQSTTLRIYSNIVQAKDDEQDNEFHSQGFETMQNVSSSRILLVQAESREECDELTEFLKQADTYGMAGDYTEDINGNTFLAWVKSSSSKKAYLDQKFAALTSQF